MQTIPQNLDLVQVQNQRIYAAAASLSGGWAEFLSRYRWDYFFTLTLAKVTGLEGLAKAWKWYVAYLLFITARMRGYARRGPSPGLDRLGKQIPGRWLGPWANSWRKGRNTPVWVLGSEYGRQSGRLHGHALVRLRGKPSWIDYRLAGGIWRKQRGRCRIEKPECQNDVTQYVSKYIAKDGEIEFSPTFRAARMPSGGAAGIESAEPVSAVTV